MFLLTRMAKHSRPRGRIERPVLLGTSSPLRIETQTETSKTKLKHRAGGNSGPQESVYDIGRDHQTRERAYQSYGSIQPGNRLLLLYKTARVDMAILDELYPMRWQSDYKTINGVLYCGIGIQNDNGEWLWRWDCGIESRDNDGMEKKGEASDAFKRAGFKWGIGRELYTAPFIWAKVPTEQDKNGVWKLVDRFAKFSVDSIDYDQQGNIIGLVIMDNNGKVIYRGHKA